MTVPETSGPEIHSEGPLTWLDAADPAGPARLESRIALEETLRRFPTWEVDHANAVRLHTSTVRGYEKLPIAI
ncbi:hypothetical protein BCD48_32540 [Pseudofrankia sp. BMG5.36]|nr:hypothetical protein BCD48_32540 [Pseudofrankia sp. BMG5.36]